MPRDLLISRRRFLAASAGLAACGCGLPAAAFQRLDPELEERLRQIYGLAQDQDVKCVRPPYPPARMEYYRTADGDQAAAIPAGPAAIFFHWDDGKLSRWGSQFSGEGPDFADVAGMLLKIPPQEIEGDAELLRKPLKGDWIVRVGTKPESVARQIAGIMREQFRLPAKAEFREVERKVLVARGRFEYRPMPGHEQIELYARELSNPDRGGGGTGNLKEVLNALGWFINRRIVSEVERPPEGEWRWHYNEILESAEKRAANREPTGVLRNFTAQTGLTFTEEPRRLRMLFLERA